jgi:hypothetical protein
MARGTRKRATSRAQAAAGASSPAPTRAPSRARAGVDWGPGLQKWPNSGDRRSTAPRASAGAPASTGHRARVDEPLAEEELPQPLVGGCGRRARPRVPARDRILLETRHPAERSHSRSPRPTCCIPCLISRLATPGRAISTLGWAEVLREVKGAAFGRSCRTALDGTARLRFWAGKAAGRAAAHDGRRRTTQRARARVTPSLRLPRRPVAPA